MGYRLLLRSPTGEKIVRLDAPAVIGRGADADVPVESFRLSRRHAEFVPTPQGVTVRDLGSRNGIVVNGTRVEQALLRPSDRVLLGDVAVTVLASGRAGLADDPASLRPAGDPGRPSHPSWPPPPGGPSAAGPSEAQGLPAGTSAEPSAYESARPATAVAEPEEKTTLLPRGGAMRARPAEAEPPASGARPHATSRPASTWRPRFRLGTWLTLGVLLASTIMFFATTVPLVQSKNEVIRREARARAAIIARALGAENGPALASGQALGLSVQSALAESGVREALVLTPQGRVLAPPERMDEAMTDLGAFGRPGSIRGLQTADLGDGVQAAVAVEHAGRQLGVAWVRLDPTYANQESSPVLFLLAILAVGLAISVLIGLALQRMVASRLMALATDIDLAAAGQLDEVRESLGAPEVARSVNFIVSQLRALPHTAPEPLLAALPPVAAEPGGRLVLDASFVIREVTPGAAGLLQSAPGTTILGRHVLEVIGDQAIVSAVIDAVSSVAAPGEVTQHVNGLADGSELELRVRRSAAGGPIEMNLRRPG